MLSAEAYLRTGDASVDREPYRSDALVAVVFSAMSVEAFINEVVLMASKVREEHTEKYEAIKAFDLLAGELEKKRCSTEAKLKAYVLALTGQPVESGRPPYQDFALLMELRNALVHNRPEEFGPFEVGDMLSPVKPSDILKQLRGKNILAQVGEGVELPWVDMVGTRAV